MKQLPGDWSDTDRVLSWPQVVSVVLIYLAAIGIALRIYLALWGWFWG